MALPLLTTKLNPPQPRADLVSRPRLIERLEAGVSRGHRLILVSASAGFGKTTLLSEWVHAGGRPVAWLSLDDGDNDPTRFLAHLVATLQQVDASIGGSAMAMLESPRLGPPATADPADWVKGLMTELVNDLSNVGDSLVLVLDDYHLIQAPAVNEVLRFLLHHHPPHVHLVVSARQDPPLPLPRLRGRGQVTEVRERHLRFTEEEAAAFFDRTANVRLSTQAVTALEARTEGWAAGLQLSALSLQDREDVDAFIAAFAGDDRYVMDYLIEEVLSRQPRATQSFLMRTAVLNRLSASLCEAVVSDVELSASAQEILERLDTANLFLVPLDNKREWYRYHRLFADLLYHRLERRHPELVPDLHRRASWWYEGAGEVDEAMHHALVIPDFPRAAHLAEQYGVRMVGGSRLGTYLRWIGQIPEDAILARPYLCTLCGWAFVLTGQVEEATRYVAAAEEALPDFEGLHTAADDRFVTAEEVCGHLSAIRAYAARMVQDSAGVIEHSQRALRQLPADAFTIRCVISLNLGLLRLEEGEMEAALAAFAEAFEAALRSGENDYVAVSALGLEGNIAVAQGRLDEAAQRYRQAIELGTPEPTAVPIPAVGMGHLGLALVHYERNQLSAARPHLEKGLALAERVGNREAVFSIWLLEARLAILAGDLARAEALLDQLDSVRREERRASKHHDVGWGAVRAELCLARGDVEEAARRLLEAPGLVPEDGLYRGDAPGHLLRPRVLLAQGEFVEVLGLLDRLVPAAEASGYAAAVLEARILQALAHHGRGDDGAALDCLQLALTLAAPQGYVRPFLQQSQSMARLLREAARRGVTSDYVYELLEAFDEPEAADQPLVEPLSERELEVLRLVAAGLSNREIAEELFITVSTVKSHTNHIYGKLGVRNRTAAAARAKELGLL